MTKRRVVVSGMGVVSPLGPDLESFHQGLKRASSGVNPITRFDPDGFPVKLAYEVKGFDPKKFHVHILDPFLQYAVAATTEALHDSGLETGNIDPYRIGISVSSSKGGVHSFWKLRERFLSHPSALLGARIYANTVPNFAAQWIARRWKIQGPALCYVAACATGTVAISEGARLVRDGVVDYCIAGASDASIVPLMLAGYHNMKALSSNVIRPYDKNRDGFLVGEGAGIVVLESYESAKERKAKIYGEILGASYGNDGTDAIHFNEESNALSASVQCLLKREKISLDEVDYVNLHGTGTAAGDLYETRQLKKVFGKRAQKIPMSSIKGMTGHMLGASGAVEIIAVLLAMKDEFIPPTAGLDSPDPECDLDYVAKKSRPAKIKTAISISMGFGGHVAAAALRKI